jgi:hypothetical protein
MDNRAWTIRGGLVVVELNCAFAGICLDHLKIDRNGKKGNFLFWKMMMF